jgi:DNA-binding NtrC family response regulator
MAEITVLVVDAQERQRGKTAFLLRSAGFRVDVAGTFEQAKKKMEACAPTCLVTGVKLGMYNGLHLIARARGQDSKLAAVLTYDVADPVLESDARIHQSEFLVMPCQADELIQAVRQAIASAQESLNLDFSQRKVSPEEEFQSSAELASPAKH